MWTGSRVKNSRSSEELRKILLRLILLQLAQIKQVKKEKTMKRVLIIVSFTVFLVGLVRAVSCSGAEKTQTQETKLAADTAQTFQVSSVIENIFYNLPLEKSRLDLREVILNDKRFTLTDTTFNDFPPPTFFKGITSEKGLIKNNPDSIQVMLIYGNAALVTVKGGEEDFDKHPMILECQYFFSNKDSANAEYERLLKMVQPIFTDTTSIQNDNWEAEFSKGKEKCVGKIFDHFDPYYRLSISTISFTPYKGTKSYFVLNISFSKEDI